MVDGGTLSSNTYATKGDGLLRASTRWQVTITARDTVGGVATYVGTISSGKVFMAWVPGSNAFGFGQRPAGSNQVYINDSWSIMYHGRKL